MSIPKPDATLIKKINQNDRNAQFQLFEMTKGMLYSTCFRIIGDEEEAHDILQEVYVEVFQNIRKLKNPEALISWMKTIAVRKAIHHSKKKIYFEPVENQEMETTEAFDSWFDAEILDQAILSLPSGAKAVFLLTTVEGYSHKEAAKLLNITESTSKSQLHYAKSLLKSRITKLLKA
ncbi:RNA polymerase sigma factor [Cyclobacterium marinum]|uniref:RNA polymerase, sigma-24 subunit, ECF subfamily n=1 Tax=Cyclobacterium marinum (strain ATCC 25205 / DSM 745 / LMG 13164 / NCIMB 1802) TaxID=880070 RepID=G0J1T4_CYCMS|nr:RNA polymerase sigma factor [Cyclobacterium marinum]AEL23940.1 RNA polymerase, sigma-24 subunit, ECF subfamily [Cyclobacterium marinum DSM 745]|tara:strand:- start:14928 stop:15458 length:531 start_codon:yes stop_codon:yes gene_type:complete